MAISEILTIPHVAEERDALFRAADAQPARMANPLSEEAGVLRSTGLVTMAAAIEWNLNHGQRNVRLFEIGSHYRLNGTQSVETRILTDRRDRRSAREKSVRCRSRVFVRRPQGRLDAVGELAGGIHVGAPAAQPLGTGVTQRATGRSRLQAARIGHAAQLARRVADRFKLRQDVFLAEMQLDPLYAAIAALKDRGAMSHCRAFRRSSAIFRCCSPIGTHFSDVAGAIRSLNIAEVATSKRPICFEAKTCPRENIR